MTHEEKALEACRLYYEASQEVKRITKAIAKELIACPLFPPHERDRGDHGRLDTHLSIHYSRAFDHTKQAMLECPHCKKADELIQERFAAKKSLANAKKKVTICGKINQFELGVKS